MPSCSTTYQDGGTAAAAITTVHPDIIQSHILTRLDGPTLASASCASSNLNNLCREEKLWKDICYASWPSTTDPLVHDTISTFPSGHRSFFSDSFSTVHNHHPKPKSNDHNRVSNISRLISAVDIHYEDKLVCSRVVVTDTSTSWFECSPFRIDLLEPKEMVPTPVKLDGDESTCMSRLEHQMKLSWILIDPATKRALNVSSIMPVVVRRHWLTGKIQVRYATVMAAGGNPGELVQYSVVVTCGGKEGGELHVREVSMQAEDMEGKIWSGKDNLVILEEAMEGHRRMRKKGEEKERYNMFMELKRELRERQQRIERRFDMVCVTTGITILLAFWTIILLR